MFPHYLGIRKDSRLSVSARPNSAGEAITTTDVSSILVAQGNDYVTSLANVDPLEFNYEDNT